MPEDLSTLEHYIEIPISDRDPETEKEICYIIRPFRPDVWNVAAAVRDAARVVGLEPKDLELEWNPLTILSGSAGKVRNARVVVAILHDRTDPWANPNVTYELALAHALGKPTLIITKMDKPLTMTSNVPCIALPTDQDVYDNTFYNGLQEPLRKLLEPSGKHLLWSDARWCHGRPFPTRLLDPHFHAQVKTLLDFGDKLLRRFSQLGSGHVSAMTKSAQQRYEPKSFEEFKEWLIQYDRTYQVLLKPEVYDRPDVSLQKAQDTTKAFTASLRSTQNCHEIRRFFGDIARDVRSWPSMDKDLRAKLTEMFGDSDIMDYFVEGRDPKQYALSTDVYPILRQMLGTAATLVTTLVAFTRLVQTCAITE